MSSLSGIITPVPMGGSTRFTSILYKECSHPGDCANRSLSSWMTPYQRQTGTITIIHTLEARHPERGGTVHEVGRSTGNVAPLTLPMSLPLRTLRRVITAMTCYRCGVFTNCQVSCPKCGAYTSYVYRRVTIR